VVFGLKLLAAYLIPDVPSSVKLATDRAEYRLKKLHDPHFDEDESVQQLNEVVTPQ
jgi:hypothetical protein